MKEVDPMISIILPVYNGEEYLAKAIESCLAQTYRNIELILINDCSTDRTLEIAEMFASDDKRMRVISNEQNLRLPASLNKGHQIARGKYITWTSDDNIFRESALETLSVHLIKNKLDLTYAHCDVINTQGKTTGFLNAKDPGHLLLGNTVGACFLYTREIYDRIGGYDTDLELVEDYDFWLRIAKVGRLKNILETLYEYRVHEASLTAQIELEGNKKLSFKKSRETMFKKGILFEEMESPDELLSFLATWPREMSQAQKIFENPAFYKDFKSLARSYRGISTEKALQFLTAWVAEAILVNPVLQNARNLAYLYKHSKTAIRVLPLKRQAALAKKCL